ncbi:tetratricopeptide repeat protein [Lujinxingia sediminis]|nr:tetratricopeptide repeat protein [Lujinxingia sediminis]
MPSQPLRALLIAGAILSCAPACSSSNASKSDELPTEERVEAPSISVQELVLQGNEALDARAWDDAIAAYDEVLAIDQQRWDVHMNRAIALTFALRYDDAIAAIGDALSAGGQDEPQVYFNLGNIYQERGLYQNAITAYRASMAADDDRLDVDTLLNIGAAYMFLRAHPQSRQALEKAAELAPDDPRPVHSLGILAFSEENPDEALKYYNEVRALDPNYAPAYFNQGFILAKLGETEEAARAFERYLELAPEGPYATRARNQANRLRRR